MKIIFAGTEEIAVPTLEALAKEKLVSAVLTTPDAPGKRGKGLLPSPVKKKALELGLPVLQPEHLGKAAREEVMSYRADTLLSFCYGKIFGPKFLSLFERKFNIHPSLLPKYRGCAPIHASILNQDEKGGITIQDIAQGIDEGDLYVSQSFRLDGTEDYCSLCSKVSAMAPALVEDLFFNLGVFKPHPQKAGSESYTHFVKKEDGHLDFTRSARELHAAIRAYCLWPKASCLLDGEPLYLLGVYGSVFDIPEESCTEEPGTIVAYEKDKGLKIATGLGYFYVTRLQRPTRKALDAVAFVNGCGNIVGKVLKEEGEISRNS